MRDKQRNKKQKQKKVKTQDRVTTTNSIMGVFQGESASAAGTGRRWGGGEENWECGGGRGLQV